MSVSAVASSGYSDPNAFVPVFASENATTAAEQKQQDGKHLTAFADSNDDPSFWDLLDVINPLQHIPVVNTIYQELTGDKIGVAARLAGGTLFGGVIGLAASTVGCLIEEETGDSLDGHVLALFRDDPEPAAQVAEQNPSPAAKTDTTAETGPATATPVQLAAATADSTMPAIALPEETAAASPAFPTAATAAPLMFSAEGMVVPATTQAIAPTPATAPAATVSAPANKPMPLTASSHAGRIMPVPPRTISTAQQAPPPITVPISNGSNRSNVPITGYNPLPNHNPDPLAVQKAMAQQGLAPDTQHPMLSVSGTGNGASTGTSAALPAGGGSDWFQAMNQALDKYQKAGNLAARAENPVAEPLQ